MGNLAQGAAGSRPAGQVPAGLRVHVGRGGGLEARILRARPRGGDAQAARPTASAGSEPTQAGGYGHGRSPEIDVKRPYRRPDIVGKAHGRHAGGKQTETPGRQAAQGWADPRAARTPAHAAAAQVEGQVTGCPAVVEREGIDAAQAAQVVRFQAGSLRRRAGHARGRRRVDAQPAALDPVGAHVAVAAGEAIDAVLLALGQEHQLHGLAVVAMGNVAQRRRAGPSAPVPRRSAPVNPRCWPRWRRPLFADERRRIPRIPPTPGPANPCKAGGRARTEYWAWAEPPIDCTPLDCNRHRSPLSRALPRPSALRPRAGSPALGGQAKRPGTGSYASWRAATPARRIA